MNLVTPLLICSIPPFIIKYNKVNYSTMYIIRLFNHAYNKVHYSTVYIQFDLESRQQLVEALNEPGVVHVCEDVIHSSVLIQVVLYTCVPTWQQYTR